MNRTSIHISRRVCVEFGRDLDEIYRDHNLRTKFQARLRYLCKKADEALSLRMYWFPAWQLDSVKQLLAEFGLDPDIVEADEPAPPTRRQYKPRSPIRLPPLNGNPYAVLGLDPRASISVVHAAWKALAKERHPDSGGNKERFQILEAAYSQILKERKEG